MVKYISESIEVNLMYIKEIFKDNDDLVIRDIEIGDVLSLKLSLIFIDGLIDKSYIAEYAISSLLGEEEPKPLTLQGYKTTILESIKKQGLSTVEIVEEDKWEEIIDKILSGDTLLLIDGTPKAIIIASRGWASRSIGEPATETVIRGPRDGFTESIKTNTTLIRRRIKDTRLKIKMNTIGRRSKTSVAVMYIDDIVDPKLLNEVNKRLSNVDIDAVLDSSILENLIEDNYLSPFPQIENTERPDAAASALYEGRVAIVVDNSPFVLLVPATLGTMMQSSEDYYTRWLEASAIRIFRLLGLMLIFLPGPLYVAMTAYHPGLLPTKLTYFLAASRINVPFPAPVEAILMEVTMELIREAGTRISGPIGTTIGIVGGLIIGQAAVEAGIVSPLMIIIVAITTIATFVMPTYEFSAAFRIIKFGFFILASFLGLYGITLGLIILIVHLAKLNSFGIPYTAPYSGLGIEEGDLKDTLIKAPIQRLRYRPGFTHPRNKRRMGKDIKR